MPNIARVRDGTASSSDYEKFKGQMSALFQENFEENKIVVPAGTTDKLQPL